MDLNRTSAFSELDIIQAYYKGFEKTFLLKEAEDFSKVGRERNV